PRSPVMNEQHPTQWERDLDQALKALPELQAPSTLTRNVLRRIQEKQTLPWFKLPWPMWPASIQGVSLALLALIAIGCFWGISMLGNSPVVVAAFDKKAALMTNVEQFWNVLSILANALGIALKQLHPSILAGAIVLMAASYLICVGAGTIIVRF